MSTALATTEVYTSGSQATHSVIWLHGLGADGQDFVPIVPALHLPASAKARFVFPDAPVRPVTLNGGMHMRAWFDITKLSPEHLADEPGVVAAAEQIDELIANEMARGIESHNIMLAGFSQGGALALYTGLRSAHTLGGIIALSTFLPAAQHLDQRLNPANSNTPILMAHGVFDPIVPFEWGEQTHQWLSARNYPVQWQQYEMQHEVAPPLRLAIGIWLAQHWQLS